MARVSIHAPTGGATHWRQALGYRSRQFQFTRPRGARLPCQYMCALNSSFQFTRPRGARPAQLRKIQNGQRFNSRAHGGRDRLPRSRRSPASFQFTRPRGARLDDAVHLRGGDRFNSRAHGGRDIRKSANQHDVNVSIHAPTGGATRSGRFPRASQAFQFTRPRGARLLPLQHGGHYNRFNSRAHGGRDDGQAEARQPVGVSIHAPTGGATLK